MAHFDYEQFLRQRGLAPAKSSSPHNTANRSTANRNAPRKTVQPPQPAPHSDDEFFDYDAPACDWTTGSAEFCGEGVICPPCG
ncbi:MAG: hypothetical protein AAF289_07400 [Cyanobacteria bacterium P01_A01_bin.135]